MGSLPSHPNKQYDFSVITATLNAAPKIEATLNSVISQKGCTVEHVVVDGCSTDATPEVVSRYSSCSNVVFYSEPDCGIYDALNKGIRRAQGRWLLFLGAGDILKDEKTLCKILRNDDSASDILYGNALFAWNGTIHAGKFTSHRLCRVNICHQAIFYRADLFEKMGEFDSSYQLYADWVFNLRCFKSRHCKPKFINEVVSIFEGGGASATLRDEKFDREREKIVWNMGLDHYAYFKIFGTLSVIKAMLRQR
jgi:glycosyltransferase involved in cell wall biosynthesis